MVGVLVVALLLAAISVEGKLQRTHSGDSGSFNAPASGLRHDRSTSHGGPGGLLQFATVVDQHSCTCFNSRILAHVFVWYTYRSAYLSWTVFLLHTCC
jgi:hypothetical protein